MATWHQMRNPAKRWHETKWSVWSDPPNNMACAYLCETEQHANELKARLEACGEKYVFIYAPYTTLHRVEARKR